MQKLFTFILLYVTNLSEKAHTMNLKEQFMKNDIALKVS